MSHEMSRPYPSLDCPHCGKLTAPRSENKDGSVTYSCPSSNHLATHGRTETWRIAEDGAMLEKTESGRFARL
ncbi:hypothetical protein KTD31_01805 [Burkholderia multivorans]|uniref:hypothetical protein n=1 Tax=Burkholderia multivorans TaxID=87883 RepID=UPI001C227031|nr:hypothetical protein [Burkholderia multivorans]MBU9200138.1 hypothetical protein [Burkholderia multivorans]